jgi:hypothetical protein
MKLSTDIAVERLELKRQKNGKRAARDLRFRDGGLFLSVLLKIPDDAFSLLGMCAIALLRVTVPTDSTYLKKQVRSRRLCSWCRS